MSEQTSASRPSVPRAAAAYAQRADARDTATDRRLLALAARLKRPFGRALQRAAELAARVEREQPWADGLSATKLREAADELRGLFVQRGHAAEPVARAFALVRAAAGRTTGLRHFPVQLMGGHVMLEGMLAEMQTGEGKTLTATLPAAAAGLAGMPVHVVTVNDYLARRDGDWMRPVYEALGLTVGIVQHEQRPEERRAAYAADITYCTNKDLGFDYLRDSLTLEARRGRGRLLLEKLLGRGDRLDRLLLRGLHFAIVDEADSVLIDEARTPLIISGSEDRDGDRQLYGAALELCRQLRAGIDYRIELGERSARLTDSGRARLAALAGALPAAWRSTRAREELAQQGLAALHFYELDTHYLVRDGKVQIVDEYTGRVLADRSWERGLQQLIEVKEGCDVTGRRSTLARITYQRLFRRYLRLAGMTGTGSEVAPEMEAVYGLKVVRIPTNRPERRSDCGVRLYAARGEKWAAVADTIANVARFGRPVLIGTRSVAASEELSAVLSGQSLRHVVLNARQDAGEAEIVARAGELAQVTVATNMAGRGTDIRLAPQVVEKGGLHVILTEFHESARIDRQLFGRCGRQGDPGSCEAIVSLEDDVFRKHAATLSNLVGTLYAGRSGPLAGWSSTALRAAAQRAAEGVNSHDRRVTMDMDRRLDGALAFTGRGE
jgi:preprotein translocase subunit SecA